MIFGNPLGLILFLACFGGAYGLGRVTGWSSEGEIMMMAGPLLLATDLGYRAIFGKRQFTSRDHGASLLFLPAWIWGAVWFVLGAVYSALVRAG